MIQQQNQKESGRFAYLVYYSGNKTLGFRVRELEINVLKKGDHNIDKLQGFCDKVGLWFMSLDGSVLQDQI